MTNNSNVKTHADQIARDVQRLRGTFELVVPRLFSANADETSRYNEMIASECACAEQHILEILDEVDGSALTTFDTMLDEVRKARAAFFTPTANAAKTASEHAIAAHKLVAPALRAAYGM